MDNDGE